MRHYELPALSQRHAVSLRHIYVAIELGALQLCPTRELSIRQEP